MKKGDYFTFSPYTSAALRLLNYFRGHDTRNGRIVYTFPFEEQLFNDLSLLRAEKMSREEFYERVKSDPDKKREYLAVIALFTEVIQEERSIIYASRGLEGKEEK